MKNIRSIVLSVLCMLMMCGLCIGFTACNHVHTEVALEGKAATCTEAGLTEGKKCSECGEIIVVQEVIPALGHDLKDEAGIPATCTDSGTAARQYCTRCNYKTGGGVVEALGHDLQPVEGSAVAANCTTAGKEADMKCTRCDYVVEGAETAPLGHIVENELWKSQDGVHHYQDCARVGCDQDGKANYGEHVGGQYYARIGADEHYQMCSVCELEFNNAEHISKTTDRVEPTCEKAGREESTICSVCNALLETGKSIPATGHSAGYDQVWELNAENGTHYHKCININCDKGGVVDEAKHAAEKPKEYIVGDTEHYQLCKACGTKINAGTHVAGDDGAFYMYGDRHAQFCEVCDGDFNFQPHEMETVDRVESTCSVAGHEAGERCKYCEKKTGCEELDLAEHQLVEMPDTAKAATCNTAGHENNMQCSECHTIVDGKEIKALGHELENKSKWETEDVEGKTYHYQVCTREGCEENGKVSYGEHTATTWTKGSDTNTNHCHTCTVCKLKYDETPCTFEGYTAAISASHTQTCTVCAAAYTTQHSTIKKPETSESYQQITDESTGKHYHAFPCPDCGALIGTVTDSSCGLPTNNTQSTGYGIHYCDEEGDWTVCAVCGHVSDKTPHVPKTYAYPASRLGEEAASTHPNQHYTECDICSKTYTSIKRYDEDACKANRNLWSDHAPNESKTVSNNYNKHPDEWKHDVLCACDAILRTDECTVKATNVDEYEHTAQCTVCQNYYRANLSTSNASKLTIYENHYVTEEGTQCTANGCSQATAKMPHTHELVYDEKGFTDGTCKTCGDNQLFTQSVSELKPIAGALEAYNVKNLKLPTRVKTHGKDATQDVKISSKTGWQGLCKNATTLEKVYVDISISAVKDPLNEWFNGCTNLTTVIFGEQCSNTFGAAMFGNCTSLRTIIFLAKGAGSLMNITSIFNTSTSDGASADVVDEVHIYFGDSPTALGATYVTKSTRSNMFWQMYNVDKYFGARTYFRFDSEETLGTYVETKVTTDSYGKSWAGSGAHAYKWEEVENGKGIDGTWIKITELTQPTTWKIAEPEDKNIEVVLASVPEFILPASTKYTY